MPQASLMDSEFERARALVEQEKMKMAAETLRHYLKLNNEMVTLDNIVHSVKASVEGELTGDSSDDLDALLVSQAKILDATFSFYADKARDAYDPDAKMNMALRAQRQSERTIKTLRNLRKQRNELEAEKRKENFFAERTDSSADEEPY